MSQENVNIVMRGAEAINRRDFEALLEDVDAEIEWHAALQVMLGGESTTTRGHDGVREMFRDMFEVLDEVQVEYSEFRDLGDRVFAIGTIRARGKGSGAEIESPFFVVSDLRNGKAIRVSTFLDSKPALETAGLTE